MNSLFTTWIFFCLSVCGFGQCDFSLYYASPTCFGSCNGVVGVNTISGTSPVNFSWSTGDTLVSIFNLCPGTYTLTMTDGMGCVHIDSVTLTEPLPETAFNVSVLSFSGTSAPGWCDGHINLAIQGGVPDYSYYWKNCNTHQYLWPFDGFQFCPGEYYCVAEDDNGCIDSTECVTISDPVAGLSQPQTIESIEIFPNPSDGSIYISDTYLFSPISFKLYTVAGQLISSGEIENNQIDLSGLDAGQYILTVFDETFTYTKRIIKE